jgi:hypothetical protein
MRMFLTVMTLLLSASAWAGGKLVVSSDRAVIITVNRVPYPVTAGSRVTVDIRDGNEGMQYFTITSLLGELRHKGEVNVARDTKVVAQWQGRTWQVTDTKRLDGTSGRSGNPRQYVRGSRMPPIPPPSRGLLFHDAYLMAVRDAADFLARSGRDPGFPSPPAQ